VTPGRTALLGSLTVALAASLFGMLGVLSRTAYGFGLTPFALVAWRAGVGAVATGAFVAWRLRRGGRLVGWRSLDRSGRASLGLAALMGATLNIAMFLAFARIPVAIVLLCFYLYPALVAAASALLGWERMDRARVVALTIALAGMVAVVVGGPRSGVGGGLDLAGVALSLSAAVSQAIFVLVSRHGYRAVPTDQAMGVILGVSAIIAGGLAVGLSGVGALTLPISEPALLGLLLFGGLFAAAIPSFLFLSGIRWIGPVRAGILMLFEPFVGVALAAIFLAEAVAPAQAIGGTAILAAAVIIQRSRPAEPTLMPAGEPEPEQEQEPEPEQEPESEPMSGARPEWDIEPGSRSDPGAEAPARSGPATAR
jgi:drug/metabolite transporter (DMT)-like permease